MQSVHTLAPGALLYWPGRQSLQRVVAARSWDLPAAQAVQLIECTVSVKVPGVQA